MGEVHGALGDLYHEFAICVGDARDLTRFTAQEHPIYV